MMFGYACDETDDLMPLPIWLAHRLAQRLAEVRKAGILPYLRPDGKTQVTFDYEDGGPSRLKTVLISTQHQPGLDIETLLKPDLIEHVIQPLLPPQFADDDFEVLVNPTGQLRARRPARRLAASPGARSSSTPTAAWPATAAARSPARTRPRSTARPPTRPARSPRTSSPPAPPSAARSRSRTPSAWPARSRCMVETFGTETVDPAKIADAVQEVFDLRPAAIIRDLDLRRPIYQKTAAYGHFGRSEKEFTWEAHRPASTTSKSALGLWISDLGRPGSLPDVAGDRQDVRLPRPRRARRTRCASATIVRVALHGRRVGGWVVAVDVDPPPGVQLTPDRQGHRAAARRRT